MVIHKFELLSNENFDIMLENLKMTVESVDLIDVLKMVEKLAKSQSYPFELSTKIHKLIGTVSNELIRAQTIQIQAQTAKIIKNRQEAA